VEVVAVVGEGLVVSKSEVIIAVGFSEDEKVDSNAEAR
jgi:hypothetical protein